MSANFDNDPDFSDAIPKPGVSSATIPRSLKLSMALGTGFRAIDRSFCYRPIRTPVACRTPRNARAT